MTVRCAVSRAWRLGSVAAAGTCIALLCVTTLWAQDHHFARGNQLYLEGDFEGAIESYKAVLDEGYASAELYYNLGNAQYRAGRIAPAIVAYERAARIDPSHSDVQANLALVRQGLQDRIEPLPRFWLLVALERWMALIPRSALGVLTTLSYLCLGVAVTMVTLTKPRGWQGTLRKLAYLSAVATIVFGATLMGHEAPLGQADIAIVVASRVPALSSPSRERGLTVFTLHEGTKVRIDDREGQWAEVVLADGKVGWLPLDALEIV